MPKKRIKKKGVKPTTASDVQNWMNALMTKNCEQSQNKLIKYYRNVYNKWSYSKSDWIHEKEYEPMNCCMCGKVMTSVHETHNPYPLTPKCLAVHALEDSLPHRCCEDCDMKHVIPMRLEILNPSHLEINGDDFARPTFRKFYRNKSQELGIPLEVEFFAMREIS